MQTFRKSSCKRGVALVFREYGWVFRPSFLTVQPRARGCMNVDPLVMLAWRKIKGQHEEGQHDREAPREKSSLERVSERTF